METKPNLELRPLHETLIEAIKMSRNFGEWLVLAWLINHTIILTGHDQVIKAIDEKWGDKDFWQDDVNRMKASIQAQKDQLEEKALQIVQQEIGE